MKPRQLLALALVVVGVGAVLLLARCGSRGPGMPGTAGRPATSPRSAAGDRGDAVDVSRIVSLSPAVTETLFELGVGDKIVGVALRSDHPEEARRLPSVGAGTNPDLEAIARLSPTLILGEQMQILPAERLAPLGPTRLLPWLSPDEIVAGVRELGALVGKRAEAEQLAGAMERRWKVTPAAGAPRVLMLFADTAGRLGPMYFAKPGSLHDSLLVAGGGRNAITQEGIGMPALSVEELLELDPDAILLLVADDELDAATRAQFLADFDALTPLRAARQQRIRVLNGSILYVTGPRVLAVIDQVAEALRDMGLVADPAAPVVRDPDVRPSDVERAVDAAGGAGAGGDPAQAAPR
jgi:ABC-type Fe3+-hydroxamate transport system substrate-binding protein